MMLNVKKNGLNKFDITISFSILIAFYENEQYLLYVRSHIKSYIINVTIIKVTFLVLSNRNVSLNRGTYYYII